MPLPSDMMMRFVAGLALLAVAFRFVATVFFPRGSDESRFAGWAAALASKSQLMAVMVMLLSVVPPMIHAPYAAFGPFTWAMRATGALCGVGALGTLGFILFGGRRDFQ